MYRVLHLVFICIVLSMLFACSAYSPLSKMETSDRGMIYGNIQAPGGIKTLEIKKIDGNNILSDKMRLNARTFSNGNFIAENLAPGKYVMTNITTFTGRYSINRAEDYIYHSIIEVKASEVVYAGSFFIQQKSNSHSVMRVASPSEKKVLQHVKDLSLGTRWMAKITFRLQQLI